MHSPDRNTIIIYNGELYNTPELRTELMSRGHEFVGHSDTEVLLHAYLEWKTDAFSRLNGIFAFAIWEKRERRLTLCRDRLGVKPLFFAPIRNGLTFGSTIDTVLCHPEIEPALDEDGLRTLLLLVSECSALLHIAGLDGLAGEGADGLAFAQHLGKTLVRPFLAVLDDANATSDHLLHHLDSAATFRKFFGGDAVQFL